uniref:PhoU domain-containing protein n=1 Tax=Archaeoglobus fulgidus TaxID=2234 RepID=A0A7C3RAS0_ARCFL
MRRIDERIEAIRMEILQMHELSKKAVELSFKAIKGDKSIIREISEIEQHTDVLDTDINFACTAFIAMFQPVARDLRFALSMIRISSSYERIADLAQEIALYDCRMPDIFFETEKHLMEMFEVVRRGYRETDGLRERLVELDTRVDNIYVETMEVLEKDCNIDAVLTARHVERIGDLLAKIGARLIFIEKGRRVWVK